VLGRRFDVVLAESLIDSAAIRRTPLDKENRRIPFNPKGRLASILARRAGPDAYGFGSAIQLRLGHATIQQTQRYSNVTDEELRRGLEVSWNNKGRPLRLAAGG